MVALYPDYTVCYEDGFNMNERDVDDRKLVKTVRAEGKI